MGWDGNHDKKIADVEGVWWIKNTHFKKEWGKVEGGGLGSWKTNNNRQKQLLK